MNLNFLTLPEEERREYFTQASTLRSLSTVIIEKDFWVYWLLGILFKSEFAASLVFKGGTSLSKVIAVIDRFSEDIDLSLSPGFLNLPKAGDSRNQANKWMNQAEVACDIAVQTQIAPALEIAVTSILGSRNRTWFEFTTDPTTAALAKHPTAAMAVNQHELRTSVVSWKSQFFGSSWSNYDLAKPGTFRLVPPPNRLASLKSDYRAMHDMYLSDPADFDDVIVTLSNLETRINEGDG